jgi:hypothetical protein
MGSSFENRNGFGNKIHDARRIDLSLFSSASLVVDVSELTRALWPGAVARKNARWFV